MMDTLSIKNAVAAAAKEYGAEYEIEIDTEESAGAEALGNEISTVSYCRSGIITVRCVVGGKSGYASSELVTAEEAAELVARACANAETVDDEDAMELFGGSEAYEQVSDRAEALPSAEELKTHTMDMQRKALAADPRVVEGTRCLTSGIRLGNALINSAGLDLSHECTLIYHGVSAAVKDGEYTADDYRAMPIERESGDETVKKTVENALSVLGATSPSTGKYDLILDTNAARQFLHTYAVVFSARSAYLRTTLLAGKEGEMIAAPCVTLVDDPFHPDIFCRCPYDGEGVAVYTKNVIEKGVLNTLLYNRMYAKLLGKETTGNAAGAKTIEPRGLYFAPGEYSEEALLERLGDGIYITNLNGLHAGANTQSGDFSLQASGHRVEGGRKTRPVSNFTIAGNFFDLLKKVEAVSDTVEFDTGGRCGAPALLVRDISVSGK